MNKIITLGPEFSYSYNLALEYYKKEDIICVQSIEDIFEKVFKNKNYKGLVPIENMINGSVRESFLSIRKNPVIILRAIDYAIDNIIAANNKKYSKIVSHSQPLAQCSQFIKNKKGIEIIEVSSTSKAMEMAAKDRNVAAIGNERAAKFYGVNILQKNISNKMVNVTRFIEISSKKDKDFLKGKKTSLIIEPFKDKAGILFEILSVFKIKEINLTKIESIPTGAKMNDYIFYLDIDGSLEEKRVADAIKFLETFVKVKVFGSYNIACSK
ncbi:MAG: prephenate dehydratase domain-containing protein [Parcubacteria group bacterium]|jgi:prephenate dehydratase